MPDEFNEAGRNPAMTPERIQEIMAKFEQVPPPVPERGPYFLMYHRKEIGESFVERVVRETAPREGFIHPVEGWKRLVHDRTPEEWDERVRRYLDGARGNNFDCLSAGYFFARKRDDGPGYSDHQFLVDFRARPVYAGNDLVELPALMKDRNHWARLAGQKNEFWLRPDYAAWFLDKCRPFLPLFEPDIAFGDIDRAVIRNLKNGEDPLSLAWPLMIFGADQVKRFGRDNLLDAPAWKVEELPAGAIWVQVWENPFDCPKAEIVKLARHLGLTARK